MISRLKNLKICEFPSEVKRGKNVLIHMMAIYPGSGSGFKHTELYTFYAGGILVYWCNVMWINLHCRSDMMECVIERPVVIMLS